MNKYTLSRYMEYGCRIPFDFSLYPVLPPVILVIYLRSLT